jgi:plastocyanin
MKSAHFALVLGLPLLVAGGPTARATPAPCHQATPRDGAKQSLRAFYAHIKYAHLQTSPSRQVHDASDVPGYVKLHAAWLQSVLAPLAATGGGKQSCAQQPSSPSPSQPSSPSPQPSSSAQPSEPAAPEQPASGTATVDIRDMAFHPVMLHIRRDTRVTWTNFDSQPHTVTSKDGDGPLNSPLLHRGDSWSYVFTKPGQYDYYCAVHPNMQAEVMVM